MVANLAICGRDIDYLQSRPWLFKVATLGLFSAYLSHFSLELLIFCFVFFISTKIHTFRGLDIKKKLIGVLS